MAHLSAAALGRGYRSGAFTPTDFCAAALERLANVDDRLNAFIDPMAEKVMVEAAARTAELAAGIDRGPLHGVPVAIKDIIDVAGVATTHATRAVPPRIATADAACVRALRDAGAIIFGKTNLLEYAYGIVHPDFGQTNNPLDPTRTAGGSSGGSAAAVAAGIVPLALGTDTGGSIRAPAAYCGIVGFKPSFGALSLDGVHPLSPSLDHLGILADDVADTEAAFAALGGSAGAPMPRTIRLGIVRNVWQSSTIRGEVRQSIETARRRLVAAGIDLVEVDLPSPAELAAMLMDVLYPEAALVHAGTFATNPAGYAAGTASQIEAGLRTPAVTYLKARAEQQWLTEALGPLLAGLDALVAPTVPFVAPDSDPALSADGDDEIMSLTHANLTGAPSISLPMMTDGGLAVGLQLTGRRGGDGELLALARRIEPLITGVAASGS